MQTWLVETASRFLMRGALLGASLMAASSDGIADVRVEVWRGHQVLRLSGPIIAGTAANFATLMKAVPPLPHGAPVLLLDSPGGLVDEALQISELMDSNPFHTIIPDGARCASACGSIIFIAGKYRTVEPFGLLGQHSCSAGGVPDAKCNDLLAEHAVRHGVSHGSVAAFVTYVQPSEIVWFSREDAEGWGLTRYPGEEESGFEKSEPRVIKMLVGKVPPAQSAWRLDFREDGYKAFSRTTSDVERELQINLFCDERLPGRVFLGLDINGPAALVKSSILNARVTTDNSYWEDTDPAVFQVDDQISEVVTEVPKSQIIGLLSKVDSLRYSLSVAPPYDPIFASTYLRRSRWVLLFAANHCATGKSAR